MEITIRGSIDVAARRSTVLRFASDPALLAEWNNEYIECVPLSGGGNAKEARFRCLTRRGGEATWTLTVHEADDREITRVVARIEEQVRLRTRFVTRSAGSGPAASGCARLR